MTRLSRRRVLQAAAASAVFPLFTISGTKASGRVIGANDTINVGVAGINGRGQEHITQLAKEEKVRITHLIDPDQTIWEARVKAVEAKNGHRPTPVQDLRKVLDDKNLDVVTVATCNHWHSLLTIWACQAEKDVYVEKPISHNVFEGRKCVEAAARYGRVVQHGTQQRSSQSRADEIAALQSGKYGKLLVSKGYCCKPRWTIKYKPVEAPPPSLDWNIWVGPAPMQDFHRNLVHYNWHWFWDFGNGDIGNQGVHEMDVARWAIKDGTLPTKVWTLGGRFLPDLPDQGPTDQGQTPNMQLSVMEFGDVLLVFETRGLVANDKLAKGYPNQVENEYYTTEGMIKGGKFYKGGTGEGEKVSGGEARRVTAGGAFGAFIAAVRSRKPEDNNANAEVAHYSAALCHLANISYRLGEKITYDKLSGSIGKNEQVKEAFEKLAANNSAVGLPLDQQTYTLGPTLTFDPATEKFTGDNVEAANALLTRQYRAPFVVPSKV
ncbi:MAG: Gfo/Idh/MocA family oxidoreductase [Pirellulaceae bacterium]|nr:Gfo/Idh/MocA family oxidoreductase [Pirellulaceae bacterium]